MRNGLGSLASTKTCSPSCRTASVVKRSLTPPSANVAGRRYMKRIGRGSRRGAWRLGSRSGDGRLGSTTIRSSRKVSTDPVAWL
jgi:hypothetical protein